MAAQDRLDWIRRGSPFTLMRPAARLRDTLRAHGYIVYDIGNRAHLEHEPPEDHTPYSETSYPGKARYGTGYAIDIMPPKPGQKSKLTTKPLPSLQALGSQMVADRKAGVPGISWLKYQNWEPERDNGGPCYQDSWKPSYARRSSGDRGHIHQSGLTGFETSAIGDDYDPVARIHGEDDDMPNAQEVARAVWEYQDEASDGRTRKAGDVLNNLLEGEFLDRPDSTQNQALDRIEKRLAALETPTLDYAKLAEALLRKLANPAS